MRSLEKNRVIRSKVYSFEGCSKVWSSKPTLIFKVSSSNQLLVWPLKRPKNLPWGRYCIWCVHFTGEGGGVQIEFYGFWLKFWNLSIALQLFTPNSISLVTLFIKPMLCQGHSTSRWLYLNRNTYLWWDINLGFPFPPMYLWLNTGGRYRSTGHTYDVPGSYILGIWHTEINKIWLTTWPGERRLTSEKKENHHECDEDNKGTAQGAMEASDERTPPTPRSRADETVKRSRQWIPKNYH